MRWMMLLLVIAVPAVALGAHQDAPVEITPKNAQLRHLDWQRSVLLAMADSMPEDLYRDKVTPEQRDFAQQLYHSVQFPGLICHGIKEMDPPAVDTASVLNSAEAMKGFISEAFDFCEEAMRNWPEEDRVSLVTSGSGVSTPKAEFVDQAFLHTAYTVGQVVANFRKHGMAPPAFPFF